MPNSPDDDEDDMAGNYLLTQRRRTSSLPPEPMPAPDIKDKNKKMAELLRKPGQ